MFDEGGTADDVLRLQCGGLLIVRNIGAPGSQMPTVVLTSHC